ncbi:hypothetical protein QL285_089515 [Trifolium repens]|nr:hypothetical protein QL285_089515 [Trifolium repens]
MEYYMGNCLSFSMDRNKETRAVDSIKRRRLCLELGCMLVRRSYPDVGWVKLNTDGAFIIMLVQRIRRLVAMDWEVKVSHSYCDASTSAYMTIFLIVLVTLLSYC